MEIREIEKIQLKLVEKVQKEQCQKSIRQLLYDYEPLFYSLRNNMKHKFKDTPIEGDDILNLIRYDFIRLVNKYDVERGMSFPTYIKKFLEFSTISHLRKYTSKNNQVLNYCSELTEDTNYFADMSPNPDLEEELMSAINTTKLTENERYIVDEYLLGEKKIEDITSKLKINKRSFHYIKKCALNKIAKSNISKL